ncbi:MAG: TolC family outer membrane protein [Pseudomonadota bacterium]
MNPALRFLPSGKPVLRPLLVAGLLGLAMPAGAENLVDILAAADASDPQWKAERASYEARRQVLAQGRAGVLPSVVASGEMTENSRDADGSTVDYDETRLAIQATQPLLRFDRWFQYQTARASRSQVDAELVNAEQAYLVRVTETYLGVLRASEQLAYARAEEAALARQLEQAKQRFNVGLIAITDVHETQAAYDIARVGLIVAQSDLSVARARLQTLTGKRYGQLAFPGEDMPTALPPPEGADAWAEKAREGNAQLIAARHAARASKQNARAAGSGHLPTVDAFARIVESDSPVSYTPTVINADSTTETIGLQMEWPLFAGGAINSKRKQAYAESDAAQENLRAAEINAVEGARTQYRVLEADVLRVAARKQAIVSTQSALDATNAGYEVGTRNIVDVLQAQRNAFAARRDLANARYDYILDLLRLHQATGALSRDALVAQNQWLNVTLSLDDGMPIVDPNAAVGAPAPASAPSAPSAPADSSAP